MGIRGIEQKIEELTSKRVLQFETVSGGSISQAYIANLSGGVKLFTKISDHESDMFQKEAKGLATLSQVGKVRTPEVLFHDESCLVMEYIPTNSKNDRFFRSLAESLATLHQQTSKTIGFEEDNYIGATPQKNTPELEGKDKQWADFFIQYRLDFQFNLAKEQGKLKEETLSLYQELRPLFYRLLEEVKEKPCLLHGDLWSGNVLAGDKGVPVFIDPAVYYGHRETDLAMTKLFGGFNKEFYDHYQATYPLLDGYEQRENIYKLYHWVNHVNLFGSGYNAEVVKTLNFYRDDL
jgi:protein-ribulosamine 3-kinase